MTSDSKCASCGAQIIEESQAHRKPCPECGSLARELSIEGHATIEITTTGEPTIIPYPEQLLSTSRQLIGDGHFSIAIVVAHIACEVAAERAISNAFKSKDLQYLEDPLIEFMNGYNLANERNRKLYTALTGDLIETEPFWTEFREPATRRNKIIHRGLIANKAEAESSYNATQALINHLNSKNPKPKNSQGNYHDGWGRD